MHNFELRYQTLLEGLKNPKDNPCWKGYKPVGTKKKNGRTVPNCVPKESKKNLTENRFPVKTSFEDLPKDPPYGFWVWDNKYVVVPFMDDHIRILRELMPESRRDGDINLEAKAFNKGLIRVVKDKVQVRTYHFNYTRANKTGIKTAYDIATHYNMAVNDETKPRDSGNTLQPSPDDAL